MGGGQDISCPSLCRGAACGFVWHQQEPSWGWQGYERQESLHQRSLCHAAAVDDGGRRAVARPLLPPSCGCHGVWLHSDYGMMDYDDGGPFCALKVKGNKHSLIGLCLNVVRTGKIKLLLALSAKKQK